MTGNNLSGWGEAHHHDWLNGKIIIVIVLIAAITVYGFELGQLSAAQGDRNTPLYLRYISIQMAWHRQPDTLCTHSEA